MAKKLSSKTAKPPTQKSAATKPAGDDFRAVID